LATTTTKKSATKAKGIRISQLAKELGYPSKELIDRCKAEGIEHAPANHQSVVSVGLAATLREWFPAREAHVEEETETEATTRAKARRQPKRRMRAQRNPGRLSKHRRCPRPWLKLRLRPCAARAGCCSRRRAGTSRTENRRAD